MITIFKDLLKADRLEMGLTQEELGAKLGISRSYISDLESGRIKGQNINLLYKLSQLTGKPIEYYLGKDIITQYPILDKTINMFIKDKLIDEKGNIINPQAECILIAVLKDEIRNKVINYNAHKEEVK